MHYFDSSALVKLIVEEPESSTLDSWIEAEDVRVVSSDLARAETIRAVRRYLPELTVEARSLFDSVTCVRMTLEIVERAALLDPPGLRSLDAIHLATALELHNEVEGLVTYDERLARAARESGIPTLAPR
ncbi:type II toxin-antitoxin system VapC family toxin [Candidatus Poriferisodalis sp.]|uniref:type II toxin-antitoxin system VapC family toxin n=1 Tax=Candidatus Poriferisodalis sp. TaxID=3101277 RepID=UPI003B51DA81